MSKLPNAPFEDATDEVGLVRDVRGNAFIWKPVAMTTDGGVQFSWGGPVLVTEKGTEALFARSHGMVSISIC